MIYKTIFILFFAVMFTTLFVSCDGVNDPDKDSFRSEQNYSLETIDSDISLLKESGMDIEGADGVFSIGWNEIFRPFDDESHIMGMAFAVAFGEPNDRLKFGLNMGSVFINYGDHQTELHKKSDDKRGTMYSLFKRPFGDSDQLLEFIPSTEYQFEVTGSDQFTPITISLISPSSLMNITSHSFSDVIDPAQDLTITWEGGNADGKVAVRLMPFSHRKKGRKDRLHFDHIIFEILDTNTGEYTFTSEQIQELLLR